MSKVRCKRNLDSDRPASSRPKKVVIHVNQHTIRSNRRSQKNDPVITVKTYNTNDYAHEVEIAGPCRVIYRPDRPLPCGAQVWIEARGGVKVIR